MEQPAAVVSHLDRQIQYHFIGIGGYGMSALAAVLLKGGFKVSGSDARNSARIDWLRSLGGKIFIGQAAHQIEGAGTVVYSTDIPADNPELVAARRQNLPLLHRSQLLARLMNPNRAIAVSGTHGKTTTTALLAQVLQAGGLDPTVLVGGEVAAFEGTARLGLTPWVVAEACESDGSFLRYHPHITVITNIEPEHLEHYDGDFQRLLESFHTFAGQTHAQGYLVLCADDPLLMDLAAQARHPVITYGRNEKADLSFTNMHQDGPWLRFTVHAQGERLGGAALSVPGEHNVVNALAAVAVGRLLEIPFTVMSDALRTYRGVQRRFQIVGRGPITVVDDYAHHPTEIAATLAAARQWNRGRVLAIFQPHRYSRTKLLFDEFATAFTDADLVILTEIYAPPGVEPLPGVDAESLGRRIAADSGRPVRLAADQQGAADLAVQLAQPGDLIITMGAGDIWRAAHSLPHRLGLAADK